MPCVRHLWKISRFDTSFKAVDGIINLKFGEIFVLGSVKFNRASQPAWLAVFFFVSFSFCGSLSKRYRRAKAEQWLNQKTMGEGARGSEKNRRFFSLHPRLSPIVFQLDLECSHHHSPLFSREIIEIQRGLPGADPGFFLGGGALVSCSTSTPINHIVFFGWYGNGPLSWGNPRAHIISHFNLITFTSVGEVTLQAGK